MAEEKTPQETPETKTTDASSAPAPKVEATPAPASKSALGIASLVLGIVGIVGSWIPFLNNFSFIIAIVGVILGAIGLRSVLKGTKAGKGITIAGLVLSILACVIVLATQSMYSKAIDDTMNSMTSNSSSSSSSSSSSDNSSSNSKDSATDKLNKMTGDATEDILKNDLTVDIPEYTVEESAYSTSGKLAVTLTNKGSETKTFSVELEAVDASGNRVSQTNGYATASSLAAGQSQTQEVFFAFGADDVAKYKDATFKIVKVSEY